MADAFITKPMTRREAAAVDGVGNGEPTEGGPEIGWVNASGVRDEYIEPRLREVASQITSWVKQQRAVRGKGSLFDRAAYASPDNPYEQMRIARNAVRNDDVVSGAADVTEGLIFQGITWESPETDEADIFNQIATDLNLDAYVRQAHRELFTHSQVVTATWWGWREYTVRGRTVEQPALVKTTDPATGAEIFEEPRDPKTNRPARPKKGPRRRQKYRVWCPTAISILDSMKVVPIGSRIFGRDRLAWQATPQEMAMFDPVDGESATEVADDPIMATLFIGPYRPGKDEAAKLAAWGVDPKRLLELNPAYVWRHTLTKPEYDEFPDVRLKSVFKLLDLKQQLMDADRAALVGAANYILLVKKGSEKDPAYPEEIQNLRDNFDIVAKLPVIISDHRLEIEIITPKVDLTLNPEKYDTLDRRILSRLIGALTVSSNGQRNESTLTVARGVARVLEARRHMLKRTLEVRLAKMVCEHPLNAATGPNAKGFQSEPNLAFTPRAVQLDNDSQMVQAILSTRQSKDLSRGSWLEFLGFDQEVEAQRRETEEEQFDPIFQTAVPFDSPVNAGGTPPPAVAGAQGGRPTGGGQSSNSAQGRVKKRTASGQPSTGSD